MITQEAKLLNLLSNNDVTFFIPVWQRQYQWLGEQCEAFFEDLEETYNSNKEGEVAEHFFGTITFFKTETPFGQPNKLTLIDGQQRITTTMLFLIALRDLSDDAGTKVFINNKYLKNENVVGDTEYKIKLKQVESDWSTYKSLVLGTPVADADKKSPVYQNYIFFRNKLESKVSCSDDALDLIEKGLSKFSVVTIELEPARNKWENPQEIFESMNSLGMPLSLADLVRNYLLLGKSPDEQEEYYKKYWLKIEKYLPGLCSAFIRDYMQGIEGHTFKNAKESNYKILYGQFKNLFSNKETVELLEDLSKKAEIYSYISVGSTTGNDKIDKILSDFRLIKVTTAYSFLMMLLFAWKSQKFTDNDIIEILEAFRIYLLRRRICGPSGLENKGFPILTLKIPELEASCDKKEKMFELLSKQEYSLRLPNDLEVKRELATINFYKFKHCKLILAMVEGALTKNRPSLDDELLQIEHIMPQTLTTKWKEDLGENFSEIHQECLDTIGNLTLIRHNQELSNHSFDEKKKIYIENSGLQIAKTKIVDKDKWTKDEILERADWIINYISESVLPVPDKMRKVNNFNIGVEKLSLSFPEL